MKHEENRRNHSQAGLTTSQRGLDLNIVFQAYTTIFLKNFILIWKNASLANNKLNVFYQANMRVLNINHVM